jgi:hypothetical protein
MTFGLHNEQFSRLFVKVQVAPPSQIKQSSNSSSDLVVTNAQCALPVIKLADSTGIMITLLVSFPVILLNDVRNIVGGFLRK